MQVGWLLDGSLFEDYYDDLIAAIHASGHVSVSVNGPDLPYSWDDVNNAFRKAFPKGSCVVTHADIDLVLRVQRANLWRPGVFATVPNFFCSHYYPRLQEFLLNSDHVMLPFGELQPQKDYLFDTFGKEGRIFVRPDSPLKLFTGQTAASNSFEKDVEFMAFYDVPQESLVVVSTPKTIVRESRFVVVDGVVVGGSMNKCDGNATVANADEASWQLARDVAQSGFEPDRAWVLDICQTSDGQYRLLEIGAFSFANLYGCDKRAVVQAVSAAAESLWNAKAG